MQELSKAALLNMFHCFVSKIVESFVLKFSRINLDSKAPDFFLSFSDILFGSLIYYSELLSETDAD